jgi:hypothetical protein
MPSGEAMIASFTVRLVDGSGALLAWTEVMAESRPQGRPRSTPFMALGPSQFVIEQDGHAAALVIHWHDLDVVRQTPLMNPTQVQVGQVFAFHWIEPVWMVKGADQDIVLPAITVRKPVAVTVPVGGLAAIG